MKKKSSTVIVVIILLAGLSLMLYPSVSNYWNSCHQTKAIQNYVEQINSLSQEDYEKIWLEAEKYNDEISKRQMPFTLTPEEKEKYGSMLLLPGSDVMGYIEIECIDVSLPIYHGTDDSILSEAVGHLDWSYLPVGGLGTHCVISGHRGLPSARLFTDLDRVMVGDTFVIRVLNEILTYEVDRIVTVEPNDVSNLGPVEGKDYCTLVTCTPYGINTHRLLVRGHRVENATDGADIRITSTAVQIKPVIVAAFISVPVVSLLLVLLFVSDKKRKKYFEE